jgi:RHS repeat-associated protein
MVKDMNKGISAIIYNSLNLPQMVDIKNQNAEGRNEYTYSASGQKLKAVQRWNPNYNTAPVIGSGINVSSLTMSATTDYVGNIIYENNTLKRILVDGGYNEGGNYYFYITDHLGNNRIVADAAATVVQSTQYYPFGMPFADATGQNVQPYKYNNKELDGRNGMNWYDYSARYLALDIPVMPTVDPLAEKFYSISPYVYCYNNPIKFIDLDGKAPIGGPGGPMARWMPENTTSEQYQRAGKTALRYFTPIEDLYGLASGKNFEGQAYNRGEAGAYAALGVIPFSKIVGNAGKFVKVAFKYSDEAADLVKTTGKVSEEAKEIITITKSGKFSDAKRVAGGIIGDLGDDAQNYVSDVGKKNNPFYGKTVGKQSVDGKRGFRVDYDPDKGAHINWWNGKQKGAVEFNGNYDQVKKIIDNEVFK